VLLRAASSSSADGPPVRAPAACRRAASERRRCSVCGVAVRHGERRTNSSAASVTAGDLGATAPEHTSNSSQPRRRDSAFGLWLSWRISWQ
jgi:hypothetical protein